MTAEAIALAKLTQDLTDAIIKNKPQKIRHLIQAKADPNKENSECHVAVRAYRSQVCPSLSFSYNTQWAADRFR